MTISEFRCLATTVAQVWNVADPFKAADRLASDAVYVELPDRHFLQGREQLLVLFATLQPGNKTQWHHSGLDDPISGRVHFSDRIISHEEGNAMTLQASELRDALVAAAKRHDDMLIAYSKAVDRLFQEIVKASQTLKGTKTLFQGRTESEGGMKAFVIKSALTNKDHRIGRSVLNFQTSGLGYHSSHGALCGFIEVILSDGDYWSLFKSSKVPFLKAMAAGMVSQDLVSNMYTGASRRLQSIEDISRDLIDLLWTSADNPGVWCRRDAEGEEQQIVMTEYLLRVLDAVYNPEYKEWIYKPHYDENEGQRA